MAGGAVDEKKALEAAACLPRPRGHGSRQGGERGPAPYEWSETEWKLGRGLRPADRTAFPCGGLRLRPSKAQHPAHAGRARLPPDRGCRRPPTAEQALALKPDGIFLSNGPGDPEPCDYAIKGDRRTGSRQACRPSASAFGHQLLALASGAKTVKMKVRPPRRQPPGEGPRQADASPSPVRITASRWTRGTLARQYPQHPCLAVRRLAAGHPARHRRTQHSASRATLKPAPGPHDVSYLFDRFIKLMADHAQAH